MRPIHEIDTRELEKMSVRNASQALQLISAEDENFLVDIPMKIHNRIKATVKFAMENPRKTSEIRANIGVLRAFSKAVAHELETVYQYGVDGFFRDLTDSDPQELLALIKTQSEMQTFFQGIDVGVVSATGYVSMR